MLELSPFDFGGTIRNQMKSREQHAILFIPCIAVLFFMHTLQLRKQTLNISRRSSGRIPVETSAG